MYMPTSPTGFWVNALMQISASHPNATAPAPFWQNRVRLRQKKALRAYDRNIRMRVMNSYPN